MLPSDVVQTFIHLKGHFWCSIKHHAAPECRGVRGGVTPESPTAFAMNLRGNQV